MIRINTQYTDYFDNTDPGYPGGKAVDTTDGDTEDGTPYKADWMNDINGFHQAAIVEGLKSFQVSNTPDRVGASDILNALKKIMNFQTNIQVSAEYILSKLLTIDGIGSGLDADLFGGKPPSYYLNALFAGLFVKTISGIETLISWTELGIEYNSQADYIIFISAHGLYKELISFSYDIQPDGLHIFPQKIINGKLEGGTRMKKWGTFTWGEGIESIPGRKWGTFNWGEELWSRARMVGGKAWGDFEPMKINLQIKEA